MSTTPNTSVETMRVSRSLTHPAEAHARDRSDSYRRRFHVRHTAFFGFCCGCRDEGRRNCRGKRGRWYALQHGGRALCRGWCALGRRGRLRRRSAEFGGFVGFRRLSGSLQSKERNQDAHCKFRVDNRWRGMRKVFRSQQSKECEEERKESQYRAKSDDREHKPWPALHIQSAKREQDVPQEAGRIALDPSTRNHEYNRQEQVHSDGWRRTMGHVFLSSMFIVNLSGISSWRQWYAYPKGYRSLGRARNAHSAARWEWMNPGDGEEMNFEILDRQRAQLSQEGPHQQTSNRNKQPHVTMSFGFGRLFRDRIPETRRCTRSRFPEFRAPLHADERWFRLACQNSR